MRDQTICDAVTSGEVRVELSVIEAVYEVFPFGQVMAVLAGTAITPARDHDLSRSIFETVRLQTLMAGDEFDPSTAAVAINRAIQKGKRSKTSLDWDKIARAVYGLFSAVPMSLNYRDRDLDLVATVCDMNGLLLQAPGERFERRDVESALGLIKRFGDSVDKRKTIAGLARTRRIDDLAETRGRVLLTEGPGSEPCGPQGWEQGNGGGHSYGPEGGPGYGNAPDGCCYIDGAYGFVPTGAVSAARGQPGRRSGRTSQIPCWNERCERMHEPARKYSLCSWCGTFEFGARLCDL